MVWNDESNLYARMPICLAYRSPQDRLRPFKGAPENLEQWWRFWEQNSSGSWIGRVAYQNDRSTDDIEYYRFLTVDPPPEGALLPVGASVEKMRLGDAYKPQVTNTK